MDCDGHYTILRHAASDEIIAVACAYCALISLTMGARRDFKGYVSGYNSGTVPASETRDTLVAKAVEANKLASAYFADRNFV